MYTLDSYLPEHEARAERAYRQAYCVEYLRLHEPKHASNRERLLYWSDLAHRAGKAARDKVLEDAQSGSGDADRAGCAAPTNGEDR